MNLLQSIRTKRKRFQRIKEAAKLGNNLSDSDNLSTDNHDEISWIEKNFYIPERKDQSPPTMTLHPYQRAVLKEASRKDDEGKFIYSIIVWGDIKKSAKSSIAAAVGLYRAHFNEWGSVKIVANDLKQADSRINYYLQRAIRLNPNYIDRVNYRTTGYKTILANNSIIEAVPIDPAGEAGGNDDLIIFSELWAAKHKSSLQMWTEMTLSPTKYGYSQRWIETYAGFDGDSPILQPLYENGLRGNKLDLSYDDYDLSDLEIYANGDLLLLWNDKPRLPWQSQEYYNSEQIALTPTEFNRVHRNQWGSSVEKFIEILWWDQCKGTVNNSGGQPVVIALDAAVKRENEKSDCFTMIVLGKQGDIVEVLYCGI